MSNEDSPYRNVPEIDHGLDSQQSPNNNQFSKVVSRLLFLGSAFVILLALFLPMVRTARGPAHSVECKNKLKNIILALHNYASRNHGMFPPAYTVDSEGKPLHSWRTLILKELDRRDLYEKIDFSKPWDDPVNAEFGKTHIGVYCCSTAVCLENETTYLAVVGPNSFLNATEPRDMNTILDRSETIGVIDMGSSHAVPWMSPLDTDEHNVLTLGHTGKFAHPGGTNIAHPDGSVGFLDADSTAVERQKMISISGG